MSDEVKGNPMADTSFERRSAQALVATFLQMGRSAHLARWLHQARQRSLEKRVREAKDVKEIVKLQQRLDAQQSQAAVVNRAAERFSNRARELAQFAKAGLTMDDFQRMGVHHVVDMDKFTTEVERIQQETATGTPSASAAPAASGTAHAVARPPSPPTQAHGAHAEHPSARATPKKKRSSKKKAPKSDS
jgi:transposase-like protein